MIELTEKVNSGMVKIKSKPESIAGYVGFGAFFASITSSIAVAAGLGSLSCAYNAYKLFENGNYFEGTLFAIVSGIYSLGSVFFGRQSCEVGNYIYEEIKDHKKEKKIFTNQREQYHGQISFLENEAEKGELSHTLEGKLSIYGEKDD